MADGFYDTKFLTVNNVGISITGIRRTKTRVRALSKQNKKALRAGMWKAGRFLLKESKKLVPVDTGALHRSGSVKVLNNSENHPEFIVSYSTRYAVYVHEDLDAYHPVGQAKFLEEPARTHRKTLIRIIENEVKRKSGHSPGILQRLVSFFRR